MGQVRHLMTGFLAGEIDPMLGGRVDTPQYTFGLEICENWVPVIEGPLVKRQGYQYICDAAPSASWLGAFRRSVDQEYVIEWGEQLARFHTNGARIETGPGVAYEISTPYLASEASRLWLQQSYDRLYIDHPKHQPGALLRSDAVTFAHEDIAAINGPFADQNTDEGVTVTASGALTVGGTAAISASSAIFESGHAGSQFRIEAKDFSTLNAWEPGMKDVSPGDVIRSDGKAYQAVSSGTTGSVQPTHDDGTNWDGQNKKDLLNDKGPYGVQWKYLYDRFGIVDLVTITSGTVASGTVARRIPASIGSVATHRWSHAVFSEEAGWPSHVGLIDGRLVHLKDFEIIASVVGDYGGGRVNYSTHTGSGILADDLAFRRAIATEDPPLWLAVDRKLLVGTATREFSIGPANNAAPLTGSNISAEPQSFYGGEYIMPVQIGTETIFVERGSRRLRAADYDFGRDRYDAMDLTAAARHITGGGIVQLAYQRIPHALLYAVRSDGQLVVHPKTRSEIKGFARTVLGGGAQAKSAVAAVGADGKTDELWLLVERETPAGTKREIWKQSPWRELGSAQDQAFYVDGGVTVAASAGQTVFSGLIHLAGQDVAVLANGGVVPNMRVNDDGVLELPGTVVPAQDFVLTIGLAYTATAVSLRPEARPRGETIQGLRQQLKKVVSRVLDTLGLKLAAGAGDAPYEELIDRNTGDAMDQAIPLASFDTDGLVEAAFSRDGGRAKWISDVPLPATVAAAIMNLEVDAADA